MTIAIVIQIRPGTALLTAAQEALDLAKQLNIPVKSTIQGVEVYAAPDDTLQTIQDRYQGLLTIRQAQIDKAKRILRPPILP